MNETKFKDRVLAVVEKIPSGKIASYGQIALYADFPRAARQVGWILNRFGDDVPWWRVINNSGRISIKHSEISAQTQKELLENEGVIVTTLFEIDIEKYRWNPNFLN